MQIRFSLQGLYTVSRLDNSPQQSNGFDLNQPLHTKPHGDRQLRALLAELPSLVRWNGPWES